MHLSDIPRIKGRLRYVAYIGVLIMVGGVAVFAFGFLSMITNFDPANRPTGFLPYAIVGFGVAVIGAILVTFALAVGEKEREHHPYGDPVHGNVSGNVITRPSAPGQAVVDENVQFTVYRPRTIRAALWYPLVAFAHLSERRPDAPDDPDPIAEVDRQARQTLGEQFAGYAQLTEDFLSSIPREGELTLIPTANGITFNPPSRSFIWTESVHREEFRLQADLGTIGTTVHGRLSVFSGALLVADVGLSFRVVADAIPDAPIDQGVDHLRSYRKIFASYSHKDIEIAQLFERYASLFGDRYLRDWVDLRAGQRWRDELKQMIRDADVFQLLWSSNAMRSDYVRQEYEYALSLGRPEFVRPTYWEHPMPQDAAAGLPPEELRALHFQRFAPSGLRGTGTDRTDVEFSRDQLRGLRHAEPRIRGLLPDLRELSSVRVGSPGCRAGPAARAGGDGEAAQRRRPQLRPGDRASNDAVASLRGARRPTGRSLLRGLRRAQRTHAHFLPALREPARARVDHARRSASTALATDVPATGAPPHRAARARHPRHGRVRQLASWLKVSGARNASYGRTSRARTDSSKGDAEAFQMRRAGILVLAALLVGAVAGCGRGQATVPPGATLVRVTVTGPSVHLEPATVRAGDVYFVLEVPGSSVSFAMRKRTAEEVQGPFTDADLDRLAAGDDEGTSVSGFDDVGCSDDQRAADRGMLGPCGNVFKEVLGPGKYAFYVDSDGAGGRPRTLAVLVVTP